MPVEEAHVAVGARGAGLERARLADPCGLVFVKTLCFCESARGTAEWWWGGRGLVRLEEYIVEGKGYFIQFKSWRMQTYVLKRQSEFLAAIATFFFYHPRFVLVGRRGKRGRTHSQVCLQGSGFVFVHWCYSVSWECSHPSQLTSFIVSRLQTALARRKSHLSSHRCRSSA